jgi:uncharacterized protein (TIGR02300 family)
VTKPELGTKRQCQSCGARYYDLNKDPITCPKCSTVFVVETVSRRRPRPDSNGAAAKPARPKPAEVVEDVVPDSEADPAVAGEEAEEEFIEDASELGEDESDVADVVEREGEEDDTTR